MAPLTQSQVRALADRVRLQTSRDGARVRASLVEPRTGRRFVCSLPTELGALEDELDVLISEEELSGLAGDDVDVELGAFLKKLKKGLKKVAKVAVKPLQVAHKITHGKNSPIRKLELKVQKAVAKHLPVAKPFISIHNSLAAPVHKAIEGKKIKAKVTAKAIADVTKNLPPDVKKGAQAALIAKVKGAEAAKSFAKAAAKAKVLSAAKKAAAKGDEEAKKLIQRAKIGTTGTYQVKTPSGKTIKVPASRVVS